MTGYRWAWNSPRLPSRTRPLAATFAPKTDEAAMRAPSEDLVPRDLRPPVAPAATDISADVWLYPQLA